MVTLLELVSPVAALPLDAPITLSQVVPGHVASATARRLNEATDRRRARRPRLAKPSSITTQVEGSGAAPDPPKQSDLLA
jgi:hypothetical protein